MKRGLILVEGQTEERFVKQVLQPYLLSIDFYLVPTLLTTKVVKNGANFKGGVTTFEKFESDLRRLLGGSGSHGLVTTMLDYYRLPKDFPGMSDRPAPIALFRRVLHVERALFDHFKDSRFLPFLALHEFEAWIFSCPSTLPEVMVESEGEAEFAAICNSATTPEHINEKPGQNPASRIESILVHPGEARASIEKSGHADSNWSCVSRLQIGRSACPPACCIMPSASAATSTPAPSFKTVG